MLETPKLSTEMSPSNIKKKMADLFATVKKLKPLITSNKSKLFLITGVLIISILIGVVVFSNEHHNQETHLQNTADIKPQVNYLNQELNDISIKLAMIEQQMTAPHEMVNLDPIRSEISAVNQQVQQVSDHSQTVISQEIEASTQTLQKELALISDKLQKLQDKKKTVTYLDEKSLPFKVMHIDNIQQQNVVTVTYDHLISPLTVGDYLAGWKLIAADFANQKVEFINSKGQHVVEDLNRVLVSERVSS